MFSEYLIVTEWEKSKIGKDYFPYLNSSLHYGVDSSAERATKLAEYYENDLNKGSSGKNACRQGKKRFFTVKVVLLAEVRAEPDFNQWKDRVYIPLPKESCVSKRPYSSSDINVLSNSNSRERLRAKSTHAVTHPPASRQELIQRNFDHANSDLLLQRHKVPLEETLLSNRAKNSLINAGYQTLEECQNLSWEDLRSIRNIGKKTIEEIQGLLKRFKKEQKSTQSEDVPGSNGDTLENRQDYLIKVLSVPLSAVILSVRATHILENIRGTCLLDLVRKAPEQLLHERDCGIKTVREIRDFLKELDLQFRMEFPSTLIKEVHEYRRAKSGNDILEDFLMSYPYKGRVLTESKLRNVPQDRINFYIECFKLYQQYGTLANVAEKLKLTRERVRQILKQGTSLGLFKYSGREYRYLEKKKILDDYSRLQSLHEVAKINSISISYLKKILTAYKVKDRDLEAIKDQTRKNECIEQYKKIVSELGHHPTTTELQSSSKGRYLANKILRFWGTTDKFREEFNIPKFVRTFPEKTRMWMENRRRLAFVVRMQNLDKIRDCLASAGSMSSSEIASTCNIKPPKILRLLNLLLARREIIREGTAFTIKYRINEEVL